MIGSIVRTGLVTMGVVLASAELAAPAMTALGAMLNQGRQHNWKDDNDAEAVS